MARLTEPASESGPVNEGERKVIEALVRHLPDGYWIVPNLEIAEPRGQYWEYDVIVVAPHAVYVVETKDWRGRIAGDDREWLVNGHSRKAPIRPTNQKARVLKSKLVDHAPALSNVWVEGVVILATKPAALDLSDEARQRVFLPNEAITFLQDAGAIGRRPDAIGDLQDLVVRALDARTRPRATQLRFLDYEVIEVLEQTSDEALYRARHILMPNAPPVRLRVVTLPPLLSDEERQRRLHALSHEANALAKMGSHPNIVAAREVFRDEDDRVVVVLDGTEGRSLRQRLRDGTPLTIAERLDLLVDLCRALAHAHSHDVIHRHLEPATILLGEDGVARLAGFDLAKIRISSGAGQTVWHDEVAQELDQRYLAPELLNPDLGEPGPATDLYALGCVAFELFAGQPPFAHPFKALGAPPTVPEGMPSALGELVQRLLAGQPVRRPVDPKDVLVAIDKLRTDRTSHPSTGPKGHYDPCDVIDGRFQVRARLGQGGLSAVYRIYWAFGDQEYALKIFNDVSSLDKIKREFTLLQSLQHPRIVKVVWADRTAAGQWYLVTELVEGETLEPYARGDKRLSVEEAVRYTGELLGALEAIHPDAARIAELKAKGQSGDLTGEEYDELMALNDAGIVHRDIKPQNLMLTSNGVKLIDFNIASKIGQQMKTLSGTPRYFAPDLVVGAESWDVSPDLFATGVVLYELLCHEHPYPDGQPLIGEEPRDPRQFRPDLAPALAEFLVKACKPFRDERFATARQMRLALEEIDPLLVKERGDEDRGLPPRLQELLATAPPNVNPLVREFLALSSQARRSNRGTRGIDELATATYVKTRLDTELSASVLAGRHRLVIVTGNAGDGKTAFIQQVELDARAAGATEVAAGPNGTRLRLDGREIVTLYDGSQDDADRSSDDVLLDFLAPYADGPGPADAVALAAINEGRLRDFLQVHRELFQGFAEEAIAILDEPARRPEREGLVIVNLNARSVAAGGGASIFSRQLQAIVGGPFWGPCEACDYRTRCPLKHNVDSLRDETSGPAVTERLRTLVDLIGLRRRRHLTMRDVRSLISHLLFRDRTCEEIADLLDCDDPYAVLDLTYFQGVGGLGAPEGSAVERGAALLAETDVALVANPHDDRRLARGNGPRRMSFPIRTSDYPTELISEARRRAGSGYGVDPAQARRAHEAARRQLFFERADDEWWQMLPFARIQEFVAALDEGDGAATAYGNLLAEVVTAISMAEGMLDEERARSALWLATGEDTDGDFRCFRRYPLKDFSLRTLRLEAPYVETQPDRLELRHGPSGARLSLDVDFLEVFERLREGFMPSPAEGRGILVNLSLFTHQLLAEPARELLLWTDEGLLRITSGGGEPGSVALEPLETPKSLGEVAPA